MKQTTLLIHDAIEFHQDGNFKKAKILYRTVLSREPYNVGALHLLGAILQQSGQAEEAVDFLQRAVALDSFNPEIRNNLGVALNTLCRFTEAAKHLEHSVALDGSVAATHCNLGVAYRGLRRLDEAKAAFEQSLALKAHPHVHSNLGLVYLDLGDAEAASACFERAIVLDPAWAQAHVHLGFALQERACLPEAIACFDTALVLDPAHGQALGQRCHLRQVLCDWRDRDADRAALSGTTGTWRNADPPPPFAVLALTDDPQVQLRRARDYARSFSSGRRHAPRREARNRSEKVRIAYLSPDFRLHPVAALMVDVLASHDRARFEITALSYGPNDASGLREAIAAASDHFLDVNAWSDADVSTYLRSNRIDIAVDLAGFTKLSRPGILTARPAPIQVAYLGYPGTTGADWIDYTIGDAFLAPGNTLLAGLSEAMAILPGTFQATSRRPPRTAAPPSRISQGLPENGFVFCAFSNSFKLTPELFGTWLRLLRETPSSVLWMLGDHAVTRANLRRAAEAGGIAPKRLVFAPRVAYADHLARLPLADLFLDTFPYNSGATAADAIWMGVPLLTLSGAAYASRMAGSLLHDLDLTAFVTTDIGAYERQALRLASDPALLAQARHTLVNQRCREHELFDPTRFTRKLERGFFGMMSRKARGLKAAHFEVSHA